MLDSHLEKERKSLFSLEKAGGNGVCVQMAAFAIESLANVFALRVMCLQFSQSATRGRSYIFGDTQNPLWLESRPTFHITPG